MTQPEHELARRIVQHLDRGADQLGPGVRERLLVARKDALSRYRGQPAPLAGLAWAGGTVRFFEHRPAGMRHLAAIAMLLAALAGLAYWQSNGTTPDLAEIDSGLLTDDLPLNAYLDKGFDSWLKRSSR